MKALLISTLFLLSATAMAQDMFIIKKSMNPKNVLHFKANIEACKLLSPAVTAYWVMGEEDGHTEGLTSQEKPYFQPKISYAKETEADFSLGAMEKMGSNLPDKSIRIRLVDCKAKAFIELNGGEVQLTDIDVKVNMFMSVKSMTISGLGQDGRKVSHKIDN